MFITWIIEKISKSCDFFSSRIAIIIDGHLKLLIVDRSVHIHEPPEHVFDMNTEIDCGALTFKTDLTDLASKCQECQGF